jgi:hypothetical protein
MRAFSLLFPVLAGAFAASETTRAAAQAPTRPAGTIIRGKVTGPDSLPLRGARVYARGPSDTALFNTLSDSAGAYLIGLPSQDSVYTIAVQALGMATHRGQVRRGASDTIEYSVRMISRASALTAVNVRAEPIDVPPEENLTAGQLESMIMRRPAAVIGAGSLATFLGMGQGLTLITGADGLVTGFSALGALPNQNRFTLGGSPFSIANIPAAPFRGITRRLTITDYDPALGGYSGGQLAFELPPGTLDPQVNLFVETSGSPLRSNARSIGGTTAGVSTYDLNLVASGPIKNESLLYWLLLSANQRDRDARSLVDLDPSGLAALGIARDSITRLRSILSNIGAPLGESDGQRTTLLGGILNLVAPRGINLGYGLRMDGHLNRTRGIGLAPIALPSKSAEMTQAGGGIQLGAETALFGFRSSFRAYASMETNDSDPAVIAPRGLVTLSSSAADSLLGVSVLRFGGDGSRFSRTKTSSIEVSDNLTRNWHRRHRATLSMLFHHDAISATPFGDRYGTFTFESLQDLQNGTPSSFTRTLPGDRIRLSSTSGALALGDAFRATRRLQLQYGVRAEGTRLDGSFPYNSIAAQALGVRTDRMPTEIHVSPRAGFRYRYGRQNVGRWGMLTGGVGEFRGILPLESFVATQASSLAGAIRISCVGESAPNPDWDSFISESAFPASCRSGIPTTGGVLERPDVALLDRSLQAPRSWRTSLSLEHRYLFDHNVFANLAYSRGVAQPSAIDLNLVDAPRFTLQAEDGRPVFVNATSFTSSGATTAADSRRTGSLAEVVDYRSGLRTEAVQLQMSVAPRWDATWLKKIPLGLSPQIGYVYSNIRDQQDGYLSNTAGDPRDTPWARSEFEQRHTVTTMFIGGNNAMMFHIWWSATSGRPFTPLVLGDINGDGRVNDRAFVFSPSSSSDQVSQDMARLIASAKSSTRDCLKDQFGRIAKRNSCVGPWTQTMNVELRFLTLAPVIRALGGRQVGAVLSFTNVLAGLDQALHGSDNLRGWGDPAPPDPILLTVRGFDATAQKFTYEVNPRFGSAHGPSPYRNPFIVRFGFEYDGRPGLDRRLLGHLVARDGTKCTGAQVASSILRNAPNPFAVALAFRDTILLSPEQAAKLTPYVAEYNRAADSVLAPLVRFVDSAQKSPIREETLHAYRFELQRWEVGRYGIGVKYITLLRGILDDQQAADLPGDQFYWDPNYLKFLEQQATTRFRDGDFRNLDTARIASGCQSAEKK